jgi:hypothetical protein
MQYLANIYFIKLLNLSLNDLGIHSPQKHLIPIGTPVKTTNPNDNGNEQGEKRI